MQFGTLATFPKQEKVSVPPPFPAGAADNGLSVDPVSGLIVLGNERGDITEPALILDDREIPFGLSNFNLFLTKDDGHFFSINPNFFVYQNAPGDNASLSATLFTVANAAGDSSVSASPGFLQVMNDSGGNNPQFDMQTGVVGGEFIIDLDTITSPTPTMRILNQGGSRAFYYELLGGRFGFNVPIPTARVHIARGVATPSGAPFKYEVGVIAQTAVENGTKNWDGSNESLAVGGVTYLMAKTLTATAALDFPNTPTLSSSDLTIALVGAAIGDVVLLGTANAAILPNSAYTAWVSAADTVTVRFNNYSALPQDPASGTFRVAIVKY